MDIRPEPRLRDTLRRLLRNSPRYARLTRRLLTDSRLSALEKAPLAGAIGYTLSPIDLVPGIVPVLGQLDDMVVVLAALKLTLDRIPQNVANEHLMALGLLKADIDDDLRNCRRAATKVVTGSARGAAKAMRAGARVSMRVAGFGMRTVLNR